MFRSQIFLLHILILKTFSMANVLNIDRGAGAAPLVAMAAFSQKPDNLPIKLCIGYPISLI